MQANDKAPTAHRTLAATATAVAADENFKAGVIAIIGMPNVGKSTLLNAWVGTELCIATPKAHTTRERILGIVSSTSFQLIFCDTPGLLKPTHRLQAHMEKQLRAALTGVDVILMLVAADAKAHPLLQAYYEQLQGNEKLMVAINKMDLCCKDADASHKVTSYWQEVFGTQKLFEISATSGSGLQELLAELLARLPVHPPYYPMDQLTDKSERFIAAEILRKSILIGYKAEIPYHVYVSIVLFKAEAHILHIHADIYTGRESQKGILIGHRGHALRGVGRRARKDLEAFFGQQVCLKTRVVVAKNWMNDQQQIKQLPRQ